LSKPALTGRTVLIFVRYSAANNGVPRNNRFLFQGNLVKVSCLSESVCNIFMPVFFTWVSWNQSIMLIIYVVAYLYNCQNYLKWTREAKR
jgi:hypothetical protein